MLELILNESHLMTHKWYRIAMLPRPWEKSESRFYHVIKNRYSVTFSCHGQIVFEFFNWFTKLIWLLHFCAGFHCDPYREYLTMSLLVTIFSHEIQVRKVLTDAWKGFQIDANQTGFPANQIDIFWPSAYREPEFSASIWKPALKVQNFQ